VSRWGGIYFSFARGKSKSRPRPGKSNIVQRVGLPPPPIPDHTAVQGPGGVWIPAIPEDFIVGEIGAFARDRNIASIPIPGYWIHKDKKIPFESPPSPGEKVFYIFHGGGFVIGSAHPDGLVGRVLKDFFQDPSSPSLRRAFSLEYRLSSPGEPGKGPVFPFPAALIDALAGYLYLIKLGFPEEDIIIIGDSAGANLALALTRYLLLNKGKQPKLPNIPAALVLLSPCVDFSEMFLDNPGPQSSQIINGQRDWLVPINSGMIRTSAEVFLGGRPENVELAYRNPYISPASPILLGLTSDSPTRTISFKGFPRTFIDNATFETLYDQILRLGNAMVEDLGEDMVAYNEVDGAMHVYFTASDGYDPDRAGTSKKILKWLGL
jgi:acetyl esterase/lipase